MKKSELLAKYERYKNYKGDFTIALYIHMPDDSIESIYNDRPHNKMQYIDKTYDENLVHKNSKEIYIMDVNFILKENKHRDFGWAILSMKNGNRVAREGWNGKNQYIELAKSISYKNNKNEIVNVEHKNIGNNAIAFVGTSGVQLGWLASQADMLANDWYKVD